MTNYRRLRNFERARVRRRASDHYRAAILWLFYWLGPPRRATDSTAAGTTGSVYIVRPVTLSIINRLDGKRDRDHGATLSFVLFGVVFVNFIDCCFTKLIFYHQVLLVLYACFPVNL